MRALSRRLRAASQNDERGVALVVVLAIGMVMLALVATALTVASSGLRRADTDQDINGAMDAAYAAVEEYQSRLAVDNSYYTYGNKDAPFSQLTGSTSLVLPTGAATNPAFGIGTAGTWATVPTGPNTVSLASFRYEVDNTSYAKSGDIRIRATGRVGTATRSIVADLKQSGFIDYLYFTDYEVQDPLLTNKPYCAKRIWEGRDSSCTAIRFGTTDTIDGPVHSNDTLTICGTTFNGKVTSSNTKTPMAIKPSDCSSTAKYPEGQTEPLKQSLVDMPTTNLEMRKETRNDLPNEVSVPGCLYTGPTVITFTADGKMNVKSPWTRKTQIAATATGATAPAVCGNPGTGTNGLGSAGGATINVLDANVIYVQSVPAVAGDPNNPNTLPKWTTGATCGTTDAGGWSMSSGATITQYPVANEIVPDGSSDANPAYGCKNGDVYVKGVFNGAMTIGAENYVYVTGNLTYADPAKNIIGLVGQNAVWVWNPMKAEKNFYGQVTGSAPLLTDTGRTISGAILSVGHTFQVQNYDQGGDARGKLTVKGSIAQKFRGPVGLVGGSGYIKDYKYDTRFAYMAPPKFLSPVSSAYGVSQYAGVDAAFTATGAAK